MNTIKEERPLRNLIAVIRITLGIIILATWWENLNKGIYTAQGITDLFTHPDWGIFTNGGGALPGYRPLIENTILRAPGFFAVFQLVAELFMGLGLLIGALTPVAGAGAAFFFLNLFLAYLGNSEEWIWTYVLLFVSAMVVTLARSGRVWGLDARLYRIKGRPNPGFLW